MGAGHNNTQDDIYSAVIMTRRSFRKGARRQPLSKNPTPPPPFGPRSPFALPGKITCWRPCAGPRCLGTGRGRRPTNTLLPHFRYSTKFRHSSSHSLGVGRVPKNLGTLGPRSLGTGTWRIC